MKTPLSLKKKFLFSGIAAGLLLLLFVVIELVLRLIFPSKIIPIKLSPPVPAYRFDPDYLIALKPNILKEYTRSLANGGEKVTWRTNADAFRGREVQRSPHCRIMVYGDSNIQARFSRLEDTFCRRLEILLNRKIGKDIEVINSGVIGFGPDQSCLKFIKESARYKPDIVIFHTYTANDFGDIIRNRLMELDSEGNAVLTDHERRPVRGGLRPNHIYYIGKELGTKLLLFRAIRKLIPFERKQENLLKTGLALREKEFEAYQKKHPRQYSVFADGYDFDVALYPNRKSSLEKRKLMKAVIRKANDHAVKNKIALVLLIQPSSIDLTTNLPLNYKLFAEYSEYRQDNLSMILEEISRKSGIMFVNLYDSFSSNKPEWLFLREDNDHWSGQGQALAAGEVANYIVANHLIRQ